MTDFRDFKLNKALLNALDDLGLKQPTAIQQEAFPVVLSGKNVVGIAQTGTGKTYAYALPLLQGLKYSTELNPTVLILVPTRELVVQVVEEITKLTAYMHARVVGVYGGTNMNTQKLAVSKGMDILVGTPGRLYDLALTRALSLKNIKKLVIDEVDVMLDLGFLFQITNIFELLPEKRQNIMFSATMTDEVNALIDNFFIAPVKISIAVSGTPLTNIEQKAYSVQNFYTKVNLLSYLLQDADEFSKVLVFSPSKKIADRIFELLEGEYSSEMGIIHANKSQNYRLKSIDQFNKGSHRILIASDVIARGLDLDSVSHVISFDTPEFPENYMHRIGRTGRAKQKGKSILFYTEAEETYLKSIEELMDYKIPVTEFPEEVKVSKELAPEERPKMMELNTSHRKDGDHKPGPAFHEKSAKNQKVNLGGSYKRTIAAKYKKPITRGDKGQNKRRRK